MRYLMLGILLPLSLSCTSKLSELEKCFDEPCPESEESLRAYKASPERVVYRTTKVQPTAGVLHITLSTNPIEKRLAERQGSVGIPFRVLKNPNVSRYLARALEDESEEKAAEITPELPVAISGPALKILQPLMIKINALVPSSIDWAHLSPVDHKTRLHNLIKLVKSVSFEQLPELIEVAYYLDAQPLLETLTWHYAQGLYDKVIPEVMAAHFKPDIYKNIAPLISRQFFLIYAIDIDRQLGLKKTVIPMDVLNAFGKIPEVVSRNIPAISSARNMNATFVMGEPLQNSDLFFHKLALNREYYNGQLFSPLSLLVTVAPYS